MTYVTILYGYLRKKNIGKNSAVIWSTLPVIAEVDLNSAAALSTPLPPTYGYPYRT